MHKNKGKKHSDETRKKMSLQRIGNKNRLGKKHSEETKIKFSKQRKGRIRPGKPESFKHKEKTKIKIAKSHTGMKLKNSTKEKISLSKLKDKNPAWLGGKSFEPYTTDWTKSLRISIRERDKYICQICGEKQDSKAYAIHHIDYDKKNCNPDNLITLCNSCHMKTNHNRDYWIKYFKIK